MKDDLSYLINGLNGIQRDIYEAIKTAAKFGKPCPTNLALSDEVDLSLETTSRHLHALKDLGLIDIEIPRSRYRVITVHEIGKSTAEPPPPKISALSTSKYHTPEGAARRLQASLDKDRNAEARRVQRDPCFMCGTPYDRHEQFGCKKWRPRG